MRAGDEDDGGVAHDSSMAARGERGRACEGHLGTVGCASGSTCPTTGPTSRAGRPNPPCAPCRARSRTPWPRRSGCPPCGSCARGAPTPACTPADRSCTSTSRPRTCCGQRDARSTRRWRRWYVASTACCLPDVRVRRGVEAPEGFDARFSASWRRYAYRVADSPRAGRPAAACARAGLAATAGPRRHEHGGVHPRGAARLRVVLQAPRGGDHRPDPDGALVEPRRERGRRRPRRRRRLLPQHGPLAGRLPARRGGTDASRRSGRPRSWPRVAATPH